MLHILYLEKSMSTLLYHHTTHEPTEVKLTDHSYYTDEETESHGRNEHAQYSLNENL